MPKQGRSLKGDKIMNKSKKIFLLFGGLSLVMLMGMTLSLSAKKPNAAGCGIGSLVFKKNTKLDQILAATTNQSSSQSSSISSGTSGCNKKGAVSYMRHRQAEFVTYNYERLREEIALGKGEAVEGFALLLGCPANSSFSSMARSHHAEFFSIPRNKPSNFVQNVESYIKKNTKLSKNCKTIS